jgi:hypothetical protein
MDGEAHPNDAAPLTLLTRAVSPEAGRLVAALVDKVEAAERDQRRAYRRGEDRRTGLALAVAALAGGVLLNAARRGRREWSWQTLATSAFAGEPVTKRHFDAARAGMIGCGLVETEDAFTRFHNFGTGTAAKERRATRFRAAPALFALAEAHGLALGTMERHWRRDRPRVEPAPLVLRDLSKRDHGHRNERVAGAPLPIPDTAEARALADGVRALNAYMRGVVVEGCDPPVFRRGFTRDLSHGGRWYALGASYQGMPAGGRVARLRIGGEPVAEVDVRASALVTLHGLLRLPLPEGDPYADLGFPREAVKAWVAQTVGAGKVAEAWGREVVAEAAERGMDLRTFDAAAVGAATLARFPFLSSLPALLQCEAEPRLTSLRLQRLEADALTGAMVYLREVREVPALPMHDGLIVPTSAVAATVEAMRGAWAVKIGAVPGFKVSRHDGRTEDVPPA